MKRRTFLKAAAAAGILTQRSLMPAAEKPQFRPVIIASGNGLQATARAMELIQQGKDAVEAVVEGVTIVEDDPKENSVGYGGLPNEEGVVELDASVMHGPTGRGGAVAAMQNIRHAAKVARLVME